MHAAIHTSVLLAVLHGATPPAAPRPPLRVAIDAGHGAPGNEGNHGAWCQLEKDHTLAVATALALQLPTLGPFEVLVSGVWRGRGRLRRG
jgi:N-acetylmuramoyl-L-alanine amidase